MPIIIYYFFALTTSHFIALSHHNVLPPAPEKRSYQVQVSPCQHSTARFRCMSQCLVTVYYMYTEHYGGSSVGSFLSDISKQEALDFC